MNACMKCLCETIISSVLYNFHCTVFSKRSLKLPVSETDLFCVLSNIQNLRKRILCCIIIYRPGHQRHRSDEECCSSTAALATSGTGESLQISDEQQRRSFRLRWNGSTSDKLIFLLVLKGNDIILLCYVPSTAHDSKNISV